MTEEINTTIEKVDWNLSGAIIQQCSTLLERATARILTGHNQQAFIQLKAIRQLIVFKLSQEERTEIKKKELRLQGKFIALNIMRDAQAPRRIKYNNNKALAWAKKELQGKPEDLFSDYQESLLDLMNKYGFMLGIKKDKSKVAW